MRANSRVAGIELDTSWLEVNVLVTELPPLELSSQTLDSNLDVVGSTKCTSWTGDTPLAGYGREVTASAVLFRPGSENAGGRVSPFNDASFIKYSVPTPESDTVLFLGIADVYEGQAVRLPDWRSGVVTLLAVLGVGVRFPHKTNIYLFD
ncbi:hypothetical protein EVAR_34379_1 [Eumeta japonica]|uniref:Uncharacterized protein n=1 Tax=Eumeta variegata TaxID=151549 RepID=A0A4C1YNK7_EUMVA|nr:hypothetical protein EVAR_34379_1 [Eumeta japonica]